MYPKKCVTQPLFRRFLRPSFFPRKKRIILHSSLKRYQKVSLKKIQTRDTDLYPFLEYYTYLFFKTFYKQKKRKVFTKKQHFEQIKNTYIH